MVQRVFQRMQNLLMANNLDRAVHCACHEVLRGFLPIRTYPLVHDQHLLIRNDAKPGGSSLKQKSFRYLVCNHIANITSVLRSARIPGGGIRLHQTRPEYTDRRV